MVLTPHMPNNYRHFAQLLRMVPPLARAASLARFRRLQGESPQSHGRVCWIHLSIRYLKEWWGMSTYICIYVSIYIYTYYTYTWCKWIQQAMENQIPDVLLGRSPSGFFLDQICLAEDDGMKIICKLISGWWLTSASEKYESQLRWLFPYGNIKNVPTHQQDIVHYCNMNIVIWC